jgi:uncharacterized protein (TIRG00374 family)
MRLFALLLGTAILAALLATIGLAEVGRMLGHASLPGLAAFGVATAAVFATYALRARFVLRGLHSAVDPSLATLASFRAAAHAVNFLLPSAHLAGEPVRAVLFRRVGFEWGDAFLAVLVDRWIEATASAVTGPVCLAVFLLGSGIDPAVAAVPIVVWFSASAAMAAVYAIAVRRGRLLSIVARGPRFAAMAPRIVALEGRFADFLRTRWFPLSLLAGLVAEALIVLEFVLLLDAFDVRVPLSQVLGILLGMGLSSLAPIPAGVGSLEGAQVGVLSLAGGGVALGLSIGVLVRLRETFWTAVGLVTLWRRGVALGGDESSAEAPEAAGPRPAAASPGEGG